MKRLWLAIATFSLVEWIGRHPAIAGTIMLLGAGGGIVGGSLMTPSIVPQASAYFNQNQSFGLIQNGLQPNGGAVGAFYPPVDTAASTTVTFEAQVDPNLGQGNLIETLFNNGTSGNSSGIFLVGNGPPKPFFSIKNFYLGQFPNQWWNAAPAITPFISPTTTAGSGYNTGLYVGTATGGNCRSEPTIVVQGGAPTNPGTPFVANPGFDCTGWPSVPSVSDVSMVGFGAQQVTGGSGATTCALVNSNAQMTANVPVAHGITPGMTYTMQGFSPAGYNTTYTALQGTTGTTLVGSPTSHASCPAAVTAEGTALSGVSNSITFPAVPLTNPFGGGGFGITANNGQHICGVIIENGDDSAFPGSAAVSMMDEKGVALDGSPRIVQNLNQGSAFFNGYNLNAAQNPSSPALTVTSMIPFTVTAATYNTGGSFPGSITFTTASMPAAFIPGSEFTISGATPSSVNGTYVALTGTTGTTVVGNPLSGPNGILQALANPGAISFSSGQLVSVILPGMQIYGNALNVTVISPYGTFGSTGTGGVGTYGMSGTQSPFTFSATFAAGPNGQMTASSVPAGGPITPGQKLTWAGPSSANVTGFVSGVGQTGTYATDYSGAAVGSTVTVTVNTMGDSGTPVPITATAGYYYQFAGSPGTSNVVLTSHTRANIADFVNIIGAGSTAIVPFSNRGWGGAIGNVGMLYGKFPMDPGGAPSATAVASLCKKTTTIPAFATANGMTVNSLYELNDVGIFGDSSVANFHGHTATNQLTIDSTETGSTVAIPSGTKITGPGLPAGLTVSSGSASPYTLSASVGTISSEAMKAGAWAPATPLASATLQGYIDGSPATTLHVTSLDNTGHSGFASFTGSLTSEWTASVAASTGVMTITGSPGTVLGVGTLIDAAPGTTAFPQGQMKVASLGTGLGAAGTYNVVTVSGGVAPTAAIASQLMDGSGPLPAGPTTLNISSLTGTISAGMFVTDGSASLTGPPLLITGGSGTKYTVLGNYYPAISADATMTASLSTLVPGEYIRNTALTTPVKILSYQGACSLTGAINGGLGCYTISSAANGAQGSSGSPLTFVGTTITDGGAIAPGPALTIRDQGAGITFPVTNFGAGTGFLALSGTYDTPTLGGTPSAIQVLVSAAGANGAPISGCTPCNWGTLTSTISGGAWSGSISGIPGGGPYSISVRAANGTAYATLPSTVRVGTVVDMWGEGSANGIIANTGGTFTPFYSGLWNNTKILANFGAGTNGSSTWLVTPLSTNVRPSQTTSIAGDRFGVTGGTTPNLPEGMGNFEQTIGNAFGWPAAYVDVNRDGVGITPFATGNVFQSQTIDVGDGTKKIWCSQATMCPGASGGTLGRNGLLGFTGASLTGAWFTGSVATVSTVSTLTIGTYVGGAIEPGMVLSGAGITGTPKLLYCVSCPGVTNVSGFAPLGQTPQSSTWVLDTNLGSVSSGNMRTDPVGSMIPFGLSSTPYPTFNLQSSNTGSGVCCSLGGGYGAYLIKAGTFQITDNGTVVCQDSQTVAYNITGGNCTGAGITSSFVNYQTGDYQITFTTAPTTGHVITAQWTSIAAPESINSIQLSRPQNQDFFGDGTATSGTISSAEAKAPGGLSAHIFTGGSSDVTSGWLAASNAPSTFRGPQFGMVGYANLLSYLYATKWPSTIPGSSASTPVIGQGFGRAEGPLSFTPSVGYDELGLLTQVYIDIGTPSTFSGSIASNVLTLSADSVGQMWEGEVIGGGNLLGASGSSGTGVYITSLASGAWGKNGSTYNLSGMSAYNPSGTATGAFFNDIFIKNGGSAVYGGALYDVSVQANSPGSTVSAGSGHMLNGPAGGARQGRRLGAMIYQGIQNPNAPNDPTPDRVKADATGCDAAALANPCFDIGNTFAASHAATWSAGGNVFTVTGGLAAHARPFVVGQVIAVTGGCSACNTGLTITSVSLPPSQDVTRTNAGQVGNTFTFTVANASAQAIGGAGTGTVTAGCSGVSGTGSNCIDLAITINTTGTFGTAKALATCGENNLNGNSPNWTIPNGICQDNGIGTLVRTFRIGTQQAMSELGTGSLFDDGVDFSGGLFTQGGAFTCNIVAALIVQCVEGPTYGSNGLLSSIGRWLSGSTYVNYGDSVLVSGRQGSMLGPVGGQSLAAGLAGGTGYSNGQVAASCPTIQSGGYNPVFDIKTNSGVITDIYPSSTVTSVGSHPAVGLGIIAAGCTLTPPTGTGFNGTGSLTIDYAPFEGKSGIATFNTDTNTSGMFLYGNEGFVGNPLNVFYTNGQGGYFEPGDPVRPFGSFRGLSVSG